MNPRYEYSRTLLTDRIEEISSNDLPFGFTVRYAVKANPFPEIISLMKERGIHFDASSEYEARFLIDQGIPGSHISLSSQQSSEHLELLAQHGVRYIATSFHQLDQILSLKDSTSYGIRINPDISSGHSKRTSTGGVTSSFGIWHEYIPRINDVIKNSHHNLTTIHLHIGSGADPAVWRHVIDKGLELVAEFPSVTTLDIGGGFKIHRYGDEQETEISRVLEECADALNIFYEKTGRKIHFEIEPGTFLVAHCGTLIARVDDIVDTGPNGYTFLRLNVGMNDFLRTALYGAQHQIEVLNDSSTTQPYIVVGHNCESGDIFTTVKGNPEEIEERVVATASIGDTVRISDMGAYCASMRARGYNSFPDTPEIMVD